MHGRLCILPLHIKLNRKYVSFLKRTFGFVFVGFSEMRNYVNIFQRSFESD